MSPLYPPPTHPPHHQTLDGEIEDAIQAIISLDQQEKLQALANELAMV